MGKRLPSPAHQRLERGGEDLRLVAQREADPHLAPVEGEEPAECGSDMGAR